MPIYGRQSEGGGKSKFPPHPEGSYAAICADVWDPWTVESTYADSKGKLIDKTRVVWLTTETNPETGEPWEVSEVLNLTMGSQEKPSRARERFTSWRGKSFTDEEARKFDWESLIGKTCYLTVVHNRKDGKTYANVSSIAPLPKGMPAPSIPASFTRKRDRVRVPKQQPQNDGWGESSDADDSIPF